MIRLDPTRSFYDALRIKYIVALLTSRKRHARHFVDCGHLAIDVLVHVSFTR
jgi:hypothetical protein